jgi:hypothetical protein
MTLARLARVVCFLCCLSVWMVRGAEPAPRLTEGEAVLAGLADFRPVASNWTEARVLAGDPRRDAVLQPIVGADRLRRSAATFSARGSMAMWT